LHGPAEHSLVHLRRGPHIDFDAGLWLWLLVVPVAYALYDWIATGRALRSHPPYRSDERPATVGEPATAGR
jgi:hypothetical protein